MNSRIKQIFVLFLALTTSLFLLDAYAGKPVKVTVTAAVPDTAAQGDTTEVEIDGTGFDAGSTARFIVTDTRDDTQIDVNEVTFDSATGKLKAKIKVKDAALPVEYDIEVMTSSGRRGKGTTLFRVREQAGQDDPCVVLTSYFPAFAYTVSTFADSEIFLASADGACSVPIYKADFSTNFSFRYFDNGDGSGYGRIAFQEAIKPAKKKDPEYRSIGFVEFNVENSMVSSHLPLNFQRVYIHPQAPPVGWVGNPVLSPLGDKILFMGEENDHGTYFFNELELDNCEVNPCVTRLIEWDETNEPRPALTVQYGLNENRIYFRLSYGPDAPVDPFGPNYIAFMNRLGNEWSLPVVMLEYPWPGVHRIDAGLWDEDGDGIYEEEVVALSYKKRDIVLDMFVPAIDIWGCLDEAVWCLRAEGIYGEYASFMSLEGHPALLYEIDEFSTVTGPGLYKYDLETGTVSTVIDVIGGGSTRISFSDGAD